MTVQKKRTLVILAAIIAVLAVILGVSQWIMLRRAHSSFDNYYAFRGCTQLLQKTDTYGVCETGSGQTIKIVEYQGKWYLDGDLPWACWGGACFGL